MHMHTSVPSGHTVENPPQGQLLDGAEPQVREHLPPLKPATRNTHLAGIDGLRAFAAVAVLFSHTGAFSIAPGSAGKLSKLAVFGDQGLTLFFALSGFLLYLPFVSALLAGRPMPSVRKYAHNRVLRIFPAYVVIFLIVLVFGALTIHGNIEHFSSADVGRITDPTVLVPNLFLLQSIVPHAMGTGIIPAWSLTAELTFYALLPLVGYLAWFLARRVSKVIALAVGPVIFFVIAAVTIRELGHYRPRGTHAIFIYDWGNTWSAVVSRSFLANADLFAFGMLAALAIGLLRHRDRVPVFARPLKVAIFVTIVLVALVARQQGSAGALSLVGACAAGMILLTVLPSHTGAPQNALARVLEWGPVRYIGLISYSLYLWHVPVILWMKDHGLLFSSGAVALFANLVIVFSIVVVLASLTYAFVEKPAMALRGRLPARTIEISATE